MEDARKIVFVIGNGCFKAAGTILDLAALTKATILATPHGKGLVNPYHPLFRGVVGFAGHDGANRALADPDTDLVVAIGTKLGEWATGGWDCTTLLNERLVHIELVEGWLTRSPMAKLHIRGHLLTIFEYVLAHMRKRYPDRDVATVTNTWRKRMVENASRKNGSVLSAGLWRRRQILLGRDSSAPIEAQNPSQDCAREDSYLACG
ncbi:MAG: hypothetical protein ACREYE_10140, partial [Gammaproteobacteria bacterium]